MVAQTSNNVAAQSRTPDAANVFGQPALPPHVHHRTRYTLGRPWQQFEPIAGAAGVAMEFQQRRVWSPITRPDVAAVNSGVTHSREPKVKTFSESCRVRNMDQLWLRIGRVEFAQTAIPIRIEVGGPRIAAAV